MKALLKENVDALQQALDLLPFLTEAQYCERLPTCFNASIGGHIRHNVDHYLSFLAGFTIGVIDYEARVRDTRIETDRDYALNVLGSICDRLQTLPAVNKSLRIRMENTDDGDVSAWGESTARRELQFLMSHTIHHYALVAVSCRILGVEPHPDFGVAPSTLRYRDSLKTKVA